MQVLTQHQLDIVMSAFIAECEVLYGGKLDEVRLFGSYARGDCGDGSDIDIMVILDMSEDEIKKSLDSICRIASDLDIRYNTTMMPVLRSKKEYEFRKHSYGFCENVEKEGVSKYAGQARS